MDFIAITPEGTPARTIETLPSIAHDVMRSTAELYRVGGHYPPWVGYLAVDDTECVGTCAFKTAPVDGRVEIAYFTFPGNEGRGIASQMGEFLVHIARRQAPDVRIFAQTLPGQNASTRVLEKLGFQKIAVLEHSENGTVWEWELTEGQSFKVNG